MVSDLRSPERPQESREARRTFSTARARTRSSRVVLLEHTERKRARLALARSCAELRKSRMLRYARASGRRVPFSPSLSLSLILSHSLSLSLSLSSLLSRALFFSLSPAGRDGSDRVEGVARVRRGGRGAEISPRGSVTNSIRRGSKRGTGRGSGG